MGKSFRIVTMVALSLVILVGGVLAGCGGGGLAALVAADMDMYQYLKGTTGDMNDSVINSASEGGGEPGYKYGLAATLNPSTYWTAAALDTMAATLFPPPYKNLATAADAAATTFAMLTAGDQTKVKGYVFASMPAADQEVVSTALAGFFNRQDNDMADALDPEDTSAYAILQGVSATAAAGWAADVDAGMDYADRFFTWMLKETVAAYPTMFGFPAGYTPTNAEIEGAALVVGKLSFTNGTAGAMYPTRQAEMTTALFGTTAYADLTASQQATVNGAVYASLPSAFGNVTANAGVIQANRDGMAAGLMAAGLIAHGTYDTCTGVEKAAVDQAIFGTTLSGTALEWDYITFAAVPGAIKGWGAELADALTLDQSMCYVVLKSSVGYSAAEAWKADVEAGVHPRQAFYRWLAKQAVREMASAATLYQMTVGEFSFTITNPNDYLISVDNMNINFAIASAALGDEMLVDAAKLAVGDKFYVPANEEIIVKFVAPTKTLEVITWLVMSGQSSANAGALAANVWSQIQAGTAVWTITVEATMSSEEETITESYDLTWTPS